MRYRAAKSLDATTMTTFRDLIPTKLAAGVWDCLMKYKKTIPNFPETETCELLILDRSVDQVSRCMCWLEIYVMLTATLFPYRDECTYSEFSDCTRHT